MPLEDYPEYSYEADLSEAVRGLPPPRERRVQPVAPPPEPPPLGTLTDIAHGFKRGVFVQAPEMIGKAGQAFGLGGQGLRDYAARQAEDPNLRVNPDGWGEAASQVVPVVGTALATLANPFVGVPAAAALYGGSQFTETQEKLQGEGIDSGKARAAALGTGVVEGLGEAAMSYFGGKLLTGALGRLGGGVQKGLDTWSGKAGLIKPLAKSMAWGAAVETGQEAVQAGLETAIERAAGAQNEPTPLESAQSVIAPTLRMTALLGPFTGAGTLLTNRARGKVASTLAAPPADVENMSTGQKAAARKDREDALAIIYKDIQERSPREAMAWRLEAQQAIFNDQPVGMDADFKFERQPSKPVSVDTTGAFPVPDWAEGMNLDPTDTHDPHAMATSGMQVPAGEDLIGQGAQAQYDQQGAVYPPMAPPLPGYGVQEHAFAPTMEQIDVRDVAGHMPGIEQTEHIDVHAPEEVPGYGVTEHPENQMTQALREAHAKQAEATATALAKADTKEQQTRVLKQEVPTASRSPGTLPRLLGKKGDSLIAEVRKIWNEKNVGPQNRRPNMLLEDLSEFHRRLTGMSIPEFLDQQQAQAEEAAPAAAEKTPLSAAERQAEITRLEDEERRIQTETDQYKGESKYIALRAIATQLRELRDEESAAKANDTRTEPEPAAPAAGPEAASVDQKSDEGAGHGAAEVAPAEAAPVDALLPAEGPAAPVVPTVTQPQGEANATQTGQQPEGSVGERAGTSEDRQTPEAGGGNLDGQRSPDGTWYATPKTVAEAEANVAQAKVALDAKQADLATARAELKKVQSERSKLNKAILDNPLDTNKHRRITKAQQERRDALMAQEEALKANIDALQTQRDQLAEFNKHSDAIGTAERLRNKEEPLETGGSEPSERQEYWGTQANPNEAIDAHAIYMHRWLTTLLNLSTKEHRLITKDQEKALKALEGHGNMGARLRSTKLSLEQQKAAYDAAVASGLDKKLNWMVEQWHAAYQKAEEMGIIAAKEKKADLMAEQRDAEKALREAEQTAAQLVDQHNEEQAQQERLDSAYEKRLQEIEADVKRGKLSREEGDNLAAAAAEGKDPQLIQLEREIQQEQLDRAKKDAAAEAAAAEEETAPAAPTPPTPKESHEHLRSEVGKLPAEEQQTLATHYKAGVGTKSFITKLGRDVSKAVNKGIEAVDAVIRSIIQKIATGMLAVGIVFNPMAFKQEAHAFAYDLPAAITTSVTTVETKEIRAAVPAEALAKMSSRAQRVYTAMAPQAKASGKAFIIADKTAGMLHAFHSDGRVMAQAPSLYGMDIGDKDLGNSLKGGKKITPAGTFTLIAQADAEYAGGMVFSLKETAADGGIIAVHAVWLGEPKEQRARRLASESPEDNRISYGCINTTSETFLNDLMPHAAELTGGPIFVLPDDTSKTEAMFPAKTETTIATLTSTSQPGNLSEGPTPEGAFGRNEKPTGMRREASRGKQRKPDGTLVIDDPELLHAAEQKAQHDIDKMYTRRRGIEGISDPALRERVQANPKAVAHMADLARRNNNPIIRGIARLLANERLTANIVEIENADFKGGRYVPATDTIEIGRGGMNPLTLMHEATHALTHKLLSEAIDNATKPFSMLTKDQQSGVSALREVRALMEKFSKVARFDDPAHRIAMQSEHEFVSEALNNPNIQWELDSRNWFVKMFHKIANALGFNTGMSKELEQLVRASTVFFGDPNLLSKEVYNRDPNLGNTSSWLNSLASISPKLAFGDAMLQKDLPATLLKQGLQWLTHNHVTHMMARHIEQAKRDYPAAKVALEAFDKAWRSFRPIKDMADALSSYLSKEGSNINYRNTRYAAKDQKHAEMMFEMATESSRLGIDPALKTFEAAKAANPDLTPETWNSAGAQLMRARYSKLETESARLTRLDPANDTPIKIYHDMRAKHTLDFSRAMSNAVKTALHLFEVHDHPSVRAARYTTLNGHEYDRLDIVAEPYRKLSVNEQNHKLSSAIHDVQQAINQTLAAKMGVAEKDVDKTYALLQKNKAVPKDLIDLVAARETVNEIQGHYAYHQKVPYFHLGRSGNYVIKFTVAGGQAEWDRVGAVVGADPIPGGDRGGLGRQWGPPKGGAEGKLNRDVYMRFDNELMFRRAEKKMLELHQAGMFNHPETGESTWAAGKVDESFRNLEQSSPRYLRAMEERIRGGDYGPEGEPLKQAVINDMKDAYFASLPESSPLKPKMFRDGDVGYSKDFVNTFADRLTMSKGSLVSSYTSPMTAATLKGLYDAKRGLERTPGMGQFAVKMGLYTDELRGRMNDLTQPVQSPTLDKIRALPAAWRLMLAPAYMMVIGYTPVQITLPMIGKRYGFIDTGRAMARNYGKATAALNALLKMGWADPNVKGLSAFDKLSSLSELQFEFSKIKDKKTGLPMFSGNDLDALEHVQWSSLLNFGQTNQVARLNPENKTTLSKALNVASVGPHYIEVLNRMVTMMTAYEMEMTKGSKSGGVEAQKERARQYGLQMVRDTDGDHSQTNLARKLGKRGQAGKLTPLMVGFGQFGIQQTELMFRELGNLRTGTPKEKWEAAKALMGMSVTTGAAAGALGLPFVAPLTALANEIASWMGDNDEDPPDAAKAVRDALAGVFGQKGGEIASRGLPRIFNVDLSARSGLQDIAPFSEFLMDRRKLEDKLAHGALNLMGPAVGVLGGLWTGTRALNENNIPKFINDALPAEVRNLAKAYRIANYGYESTSPGNQVLIPKEEVTGWNVIAQSLGLQSAERAEIGERTFAFHTNRQLLQARQSVLRNNIYRAVDQEDYGEVERALVEAYNFQRLHPEMGMDIRAGLKQRAKERAVAQMSGTGILAAPRMYPTLEKYQFTGRE